MSKKDEYKNLNLNELSYELLRQFESSDELHETAFYRKYYELYGRANLVSVESKNIELEEKVRRANSKFFNSIDGIREAVLELLRVAKKGGDE